MTLFHPTIFVGAFLLFLIQPLLARFILPWFGGSPAVWTTCLLFFQIALLAGYGYAHALSRWLQPRMQVVVQGVLTAAALAFVPILPGPQWKPGTDGEPTLRILALLFSTVGLPYVVLAGTSPLVQSWFGRVHPARPAYGLYAWSNVGSLLGLIVYPFVLEPLMTRQSQAMLWALGLVLYAILIVACIVSVWRKTSTARETLGSESSWMPQDTASTAAEASAAGATGATGRGLSRSAEAGGGMVPSWFDQGMWLGLSACASVLLLAITNKMCHDVAVIPFLWILPLTLYLLSFILCFAGPRWYGWRFYLIALVPTVILAGFLQVDVFQLHLPLTVQIPAYAWILFNCAMICHGEVYGLRPSTEHLTRYYLVIAAGGALGAVFVAVLAPLIFKDYWELECGLSALLALLFLVHRRKGSQLAGFPVWNFMVACGVALAMALAFGPGNASEEVVTSTRSFYGVLKIVRVFNRNPNFDAVKLMFGSTTQGYQMVAPDLHRVATSYYHEQSGLGVAMSALPRQANRRIGVLGLGAGTIAAYGRPGDVIRFYEINPVVPRLANRHFSFVKDSAAQVEIVMGDARLSMEREPAQGYDILVLDAFRGDAVPTHLLTKECFEVYLRHIRPDGVIAVHTSNRYLKLTPVMDNVAATFGLESASLLLGDGGKPWASPSRWHLLSRSKELMGHPTIRSAASKRSDAPNRFPLWTDEYVSLFQILE